MSATGCLRLRGTTYWFRRRVPDALTSAVNRTEINRSLETGQKRLAQRRAHILFTLTEQIFAVAHSLTDLSLAEEEVAPLIRRLHDEAPWSGQTLQSVIVDIRAGRSERLKAIMENGTRIIDSLPENEREKVLASIERMLDAQREHVVGLQVRKLEKSNQLIELKGALAHLQIQKESSARLKTAQDGLQEIQNSLTALEQRALDKQEGPIFSDFMEEFLAVRTKGNDQEKAWSTDVVAQARTTFRVFLSLVGDVPVASLTRRQVGQFKADMLKMPAHWGKSRTVELTARQHIERAEASKTSVLTLSAKTVKRHFSALSGFWTWLEQHDLVPANVWGGWFRHTKRVKSAKKRQPFAPEHLVAIFGSDWFGEKTAWDSPRRWVPMIALWSGMRLEEICRLRPSHDIRQIDGVMCFDVCEHHDGWTPKSEAGIRRVPIHPMLLEMGFLQLVEHNRTRGAVHLFPELEHLASERRKMLGSSMTRDFSHLKDKRLNLPKNRVFHSFRHSAITAVHNVHPALPRDWIDAVMGHSADDGESEGRKTYTDGYSVENLKAVIDALRYPDEVTQILEQFHPKF